MEKPFGSAVACNSIFGSERFLDTINYLFFRWCDECKYEDINDYRNPIYDVLLPICPGIEKEKIRMTSEPFGFRYATLFTTAKGKTPIPVDVIFEVDRNFNKKWKIKA